MYNIRWSRRSIFVSVLTFVVYIYLMYILYWWTWILFGSFPGVYAVWWIVATCIFLGVSHFFALEIQHISRRMIVWVLGWLAICAFIVWWFIWVTWLLLLLSVVFHIWYILFLLAKLEMFHTYKYFPVWTLVTHGIKHSLILFTLVFCGLIAASRKTIDIDCMKLFAWWEYIVSYLPPWLVEEEVTSETFSSISMWELFWLQENDIDSFIADMRLLEQVRWTESSWQEKTSIFTHVYTIFVNELSTDKNFINEWFCSLILQQITKKKQSDLFVYSTSFLLFFLLHPLVKLFSGVVSIFAMVVFHILAWFGVYVHQTTVWEIEEIL